MNHVDTFTGILGFALAAYRTWGDDYNLLATCEIDPFCQKVIKARTSDGSLGEQNRTVPIISDIRDLTYERIEKEPVFLLTAGFPCQPFSCAGQRKGKDDNRYLFPELLRAIQDIKPRWVVLENVPGILNIERGVVIDTVLSELETSGYWTQAFQIPAAACDAPHLRQRIWIVANNDGKRQQDLCIQSCGKGQKEVAEINRTSTDVADTSSNRFSKGVGECKGEDSTEKIGKSKNRERNGERFQSEATTSCQDVADTKGINVEGSWHKRQGDKKRSRQASSLGEGGRNNWRWSTEPNVGRVAHGVSNRVDRLKSLGNAIVPAVAQKIFQAIKELKKPRR